ncbi:MAG: 4'-phosphopantetheinyl transferase superfamily protein [Desulfobacteraceae bacterium]|nr:4'-phosphopantetheinyl transferase superfamily protein [Desulfobacteraceae bacterium]MCB9494233.1 4'-phosphopantetheinyl transferase superfamily protein [Desulfobacteraceae bacterium]
MKNINRLKISEKDFPEIKIINFTDKLFECSDLSGVHVWKINITHLKEDFIYFESLLSLDEKEKALRFKFHDDRKRFVVSRACLRILCGMYLSKSPELIEISHTGKGKPYISEADFSFNVSHSKNIVLIGFSSSEYLGIDVEYNRDMNDFMSISKNYFHEKEIEVIESLPKALKKSWFLRCWTLKEAYVKAIGKGLGKSLKSFYAEGNLFEDNFLEITDIKECQKFLVHSFIPDNDYFAAVCFSLV